MIFPVQVPNFRIKLHSIPDKKEKLSLLIGSKKMSNLTRKSANLSETGNFDLQHHKFLENQNESYALKIHFDANLALHLHLMKDWKKNIASL